MWEPNSAGGVNNHNRGIILLISVFSFCLFIYKVWGPLLIITCTLILVVHTCYSLLVNDSLLAPYTLVLLRYVKELGVELAVTIKALVTLGLTGSKEFLQYLKEKYRERSRRFQEEVIIEDDMNGRHRNIYRLSTSGTELADQISPVSNDLYHSFALNGGCDVARTSTPIPRGVIWKKGNQQNGDLGLFTPIVNAPGKKMLPSRSENKQPSLMQHRSEEILYSPKGAPWGNNISSKMREKSPNVKTVQTIAGPLLASTKYNIDSKTYTDISSPGLTSRLTKYANEASNKLTHQPQYGTGQFPKVNLNASPKPLLSPKVVRARMPVTVRVAPPEITNYSPPDSQTHQEKHKLFSNPSTLDIKEPKPGPSFDQVLKEISLKRHAIREDMLELAKKQRTEKVSEGQLENLEEMMQKRARDESMTSEDDLSPQSKTQRPTKRSKPSSCHDILNSLSSSINVISGVKRKAMDTSRCNTPDVEKHFKASSKSPNRSSPSISIISLAETSKLKEQLSVQIPITHTSAESHSQKDQEKSLEVATKDNHTMEKQQSHSSKTFNLPQNINKKASPPVVVENLTDKLFMRAEPKTNEKLKNIIEEQGNIEVTFISDDKDEIKKQDIVNMRQNSLRLRLQSMFDAISGKSANKIDPDVVIQAEEVRPSTSTSYTSLNCLTTTTTVNTSPITTTIVPILKTDNETKSYTTKHVTFNLPIMTSATATITETPKSTESKSSDKAPIWICGGLPNFESTFPNINFNNSAVTSASENFTHSLNQTSTSGFTFPTTTATTSSNSITDISTTNASVSSNLFAPKSTVTSENSNSTFTMSSSGFSFGNPAKITSSAANAVTSLAANAVTSAPANTVTSAPANTVTSAPANTVTSTPVTGFASIASPAVSKNIETGMPSSIIQSAGNVLAKSPATTTLSLTTSTLPVFGSEKKDNGFSFGITPTSTISSTNTTTSQSIFGATKSTSIFSADNITTTATTATTTTISSLVPAMNTATATTSVAAPPVFNFKSTISKPPGGFSFGGVSTTSSNVSTTSTFGTAVQTLTSINSSSSSNTFVAPTSSINTGNPTVTTSTTAFGSSTPSLFGTPNLFSGTATAGSSTMFKSPITTTTAPIFGSQTNTPTFGTKPATIPTTTSTPSLFGTNVSTTTNATVPNLFGNVAAPAATTTTNPTLSAFGGSGQTPQGNIFSGVNATTASSSSSIFGSVATTTPGGLFSGVNIATPNLISTTNTAENSNIFGQAKSPQSLSFGTNNSGFGSTGASATFSTPNTNTSAFQVGSSAPVVSSLPSFNAIKPAAQFGVPSNTPQTSSTGSIFGSASGFGTTTGDAASTFATPAAGGFGIQSGGSSFGSSVTGSSPFGAQATTPSTLFGNGSSAANSGATGATSFSFGGNQTQPSQQPTSSFSFGGNSGTNTTSGGGMFQFTGSAANKPAGFNFNAPTATPSINFSAGTAPAFNAPQGAPTFNAPPNNMFSIGSGSSTPRSRTSRQRRQR